MNNNLITKRSITAGLIAFLSLLLFYFILLTLANSLSHALEQFTEMWYWLLFLALGFGVQFSLYWLIRDSIKNARNLAGKSGVVASGSVSTVSMIACCAHHLVDFAPLVGLSALWIFLADYQISFVLIGLFANLIGIIYLLEIIKKHGLIPDSSFLLRLTKANLLNLKIILFVLAIIIISLSFVYSKTEPLSGNETLKSNLSVDIINLSPAYNDEKGLSIEADPLDFKPGDNLMILVNLSTHEGDLDFDLLKKAILIDDQNREYQPTSWDGGIGGHHLTGNLTFPKIDSQAKTLQLTIKDVYGIPERSFSWTISQ